MNDKCCKCGGEAEIKFGSNGVTTEWYCRECLYETFPLFKQVFEDIESMTESLEETEEVGRVLH